MAIAVVMDNFLPFPAETKLRFGVDPDYRSVSGDRRRSVSNTFRHLALVYAARYRLPKILLVRMALNILINELVAHHPSSGMIAFSFWLQVERAQSTQLVRAVRCCAGASEKSRLDIRLMQLLP